MFVYDSHGFQVYWRQYQKVWVYALWLSIFNDNCMSFGAYVYQLSLRVHLHILPLGFSELGQSDSVNFKCQVLPVDSLTYLGLDFD